MEGVCNQSDSNCLRIVGVQGGGQCAPLPHARLYMNCVFTPVSGALPKTPKEKYFRPHPREQGCDLRGRRETGYRMITELSLPPGRGLRPSLPRAMVGILFPSRPSPIISLTGDFLTLLLFGLRSAEPSLCISREVPTCAFPPSPSPSLPGIMPSLLFSSSGHSPRIPATAIAGFVYLFVCLFIS